MTTNYEPLARSKKISETEKAVLIEWTMTGKYVEDEQVHKKWFPKKFVIQNEYGVWMCIDWLYHKTDKELRPKYQEHR
jgi:hypothetical protein